jgi:imidazole glycerol phosphate synthase subunit HisF
MTRTCAMLLTDGREVYQSFSGHNVVVAGGLENALEHSVYRGFQEIMLCMAGKRTFEKSYWQDLKYILRNNYVGIPITLCGGFSTEKAHSIIESGTIERIAVNSPIFSENNNLKKIQESFGNQYLIAHVPIKINERGRLDLIDFSSNKVYPLTIEFSTYLRTFDEISIHDIIGHGSAHSEQVSLILNEYLPRNQIIYTGGIKNKFELDKLSDLNFSALAIDNSVFYAERRL